MKVPPWNFHAYENSLLGPFSNNHAQLAKTLHNSHLWANNKKNEVFCNVTCSQLFFVQNITLFTFCERFEHRSHFISWVSMIIWWTYTVVQYRTAVVDSNWHFNNPCGSHLQSQLVSCTITCILQPYNICGTQTDQPLHNDYLLTNVSDKDKPEDRQEAVYKIKCCDRQPTYTNISLWPWRRLLHVQVVKTSVTENNNSPIQDCIHLDDHTQPNNNIMFMFYWNILYMYMDCVKC